MTGLVDEVSKLFGARKPEPPNFAEQALVESEHAEDVFQDQEPGIAQRRLPRFAEKQIARLEAANSLAFGQVVITDSPTPIVGQRANRSAIVLVSFGGNDIFIGDNSVGALTGLLLEGNKGSQRIIAGTFGIFAICASGKQQRVSFLELFS